MCVSDEAKCRAWGDYPQIYKYYTYSDSLAPWLGPDADVFTLGTLQIGWMMEGLSIDPFDSNHWLYGTGATIYGGHDLLKWDTTQNVTLESLADGIEETSVQALISPPTGPSLLSGLGDIEGEVFGHWVWLLLTMLLRVRAQQSYNCTFCRILEPRLDHCS